MWRLLTHAANKSTLDVIVFTIVLVAPRLKDKVFLFPKGAHSKKLYD